MPIIKAEPSKDHPVPFDLSDEDFDNFADKLASIGNTAELLEQLGAPVESTKENLEEEAALLDAAIDKPKNIPPTIQLTRCPWRCGLSYVRMAKVGRLMLTACASHLLISC